MKSNKSVSEQWINCTIGDICSPVSNTYRGNAEKVVLVNTSDVFEGTVLNHEFVDNKNLKGQFKKTFQAEDILYSEIRPANKRFAFIDFQQTENYIASTKLMVIRAYKEKVLPQFLYTILKSQNIINQLQHLAETRSGTFPQITFSTELATMPIMLPNINTQRLIVSIVSALDDKIELNNKINENLEHQAQALFNNMFIENPSVEWKQGVLSDIAIITMGQSPSGSSYNEDGDGMVFFQGRTDFGFRFPTRRLFTSEPKRLAEVNDILMSVRAPVGDLNIAYEKCCIGRGLASIKSKDNHQSFVLYTMFELQAQLNIFNGEGTVFGSINRDSLNSMPIRIPSLEERDKFESIVAPMDHMIRKNYEETCRLQTLRDSLLPKLMSGEIDVSEVSISAAKFSFTNKPTIRR